MNNILKVRTINVLQSKSFFIPSYQRGYRWSKNEVLDLLNDIHNFSAKETKTGEKTWYCLQPLVLKKIKDNTYEVIDGQQRLTTIYLILYHLNQYLAEDYREILFELKYETRKGSEDFLNNLEEESKSSTSNENIDFHHINDAYKTIKEWFNSNTPNFNRNDFESKFKFSTKVIWYESLEDDPISVFTRINVGKIPLTNSELIKALFLNRSNFSNQDFEKIKLRQLEIATEWDLIEQSLQNNNFWYFLNNKNQNNNRIEFIFNLMNENNDDQDKYSTFRYFNNKFLNKNENTINSIWHEIKTRYQTFYEWFNNRELYHKIGYLFVINHLSIKELYEESTGRTKKDFILYIDTQIKFSIKNINLEELQFYNKEDVWRVLVLYNVLTILNSGSKTSFFPFNLLKNEKWDIEHITSVNDPSIIREIQAREKWINDATSFIDIDTPDGKALKKNIQNFDDYGDSDSFNELFNNVISHFNREDKSEVDVNHISNLTLLDATTNRSYKNAVFPVKRKTIIDRDKNGVFIPICTKNVFLKYFSEYPPKISFWTTEDRLHYEKDLYNTIESIK